MYVAFHKELRMGRETAMTEGKERKERRDHAEKRRYEHKASLSAGEERVAGNSTEKCVDRMGLTDPTCT